MNFIVFNDYPHKYHDHEYIYLFIVGVTSFMDWYKFLVRLKVYKFLKSSKLYPYKALQFVYKYFSLGKYYPIFLKY